MPYNNIISRTDAAALIPEEASSQIWSATLPASAALSLFRQVRMARGQQRIPVMSALAVAYWVSPTDTGIKQTTEVDWSNIYLNVEEIACIVPIPQAVLDDAAFDIWGECRPVIAAAIGRTLDAAVFFGTQIPSSWGTGIGPSAVAAGNTVNSGTTAANGGLSADYVNMYAKVWEDGFNVDFALSAPTSRATLYNQRDTTGQRLADITSVGGQEYVAGVPVTHPMGGLWPAVATGAITAFSGDRTQALVGIRQDITYKVLTEAVITDGAGVIQYNLAQQDMAALRVVFRVAFAVPNPITFEQQTGANRYPFSVLRAP